MITLIAFFVLSILFSFLCSIWEAVLLSITPSYVKRLQTEGRSAGDLLEEFKKDIDRPLSAILTLNTIAHTVGAIGVGAQAATIFADNQVEFLGISISYEGIVAALMTLAILLLSEIIPKTIGANNWKNLAGFTANSLRIIILILYPLVWVSQLITKSLKKNKGESVLSRSDLKAVAEVAEESGEIDAGEHTVIRNLLEMQSITAKDIMTPRIVMRSADMNTSIQDYYQDRKPHIFSRIPLRKGKSEEIEGIFLKDDMLQSIIEGNGEKALSTILRPVITVPENISLPKLLDKLSTKHEHMAIVVDEYGGLTGLVTLEDIFETLFGREIMDETDTVDDLQAYARKKWQERAKNLGLID